MLFLLLMLLLVARLVGFGLSGCSSCHRQSAVVELPDRSIDRRLGLQSFKQIAHLPARRLQLTCGRGRILLNLVKLMLALLLHYDLALQHFLLLCDSLLALALNPAKGFG